jgi:hypothetical protein
MVLIYNHRGRKIPEDNIMLAGGSSLQEIFQDNFLRIVSHISPTFLKL